jgi:hypothetical protein
MSWTTSTSDLRTLLNDNTNDRLAYRKKCFGTCDGTNTVFKTFEFRRITNFTASNGATLGVFINGVQVLNTNISYDDVNSGEFSFVATYQPTGPTQVVTATYYTQQFLDSELVDLIIRATQSLGLGNDPTLVNPALQDAVLNYAASEGQKKLAMRWTQRASDVFLLEDIPKQESLKIADTYTNLADQYYKNAVKMRDDFYTRQGQTLAPNFINNFGYVSAVTPRK